MGGGSFTTGRFISWHWSAKAELQLSVFGLYFKMDSDSQSHNVFANERLELLDDLRLWLIRNVGSKGKISSFWFH